MQITVADYVSGQLYRYYPNDDVDVAIPDYKGMLGTDIVGMTLTEDLRMYAEECIRMSTWDMNPPAIPFNQQSGVLAN